MTASTLYVATTNPGKLRDFSVAAQANGISILPLPNLAAIVAPPEDEPTFRDNAIAKAAYYSRYRPGEIVIADDSGLEVDALDGAPGVLSARYAMVQGCTGAGLTPDELNNKCLLLNLAHVSAEHRAARYKCSLAAVKDGECLFTSQGMVEGAILAAPRGTGGFGYDPLFYLSTLSKTMAELDPETKHLLSHRGRAIRSLMKTLEHQLV